MIFSVIGLINAVLVPKLFTPLAQRTERLPPEQKVERSSRSRGIDCPRSSGD